MIDSQGDSFRLKVKSWKILGATKGHYMQGGSPDDTRDYFRVELKGSLSGIQPGHFSSPMISGIVERAMEIAASYSDGDPASAAKFSVSDAQRGALHMDMLIGGSEVVSSQRIELHAGVVNASALECSFDLGLHLFVESAALALLVVCEDIDVEMRFTPAQVEMDLSVSVVTDDEPGIPFGDTH